MRLKGAMLNLGTGGLVGVMILLRLLLLLLCMRECLRPRLLPRDFGEAPPGVIGV